MRFTSRAKISAMTVVATVLLIVSMTNIPALAGGQLSSLYPVVVTVDGDTVFIASHSSNREKGNWIELSGGSLVTIPELTLAYEGPDIAVYPKPGVTVTIESLFKEGSATYPLDTHQVYSTSQSISATFWGASALGGEVVDFMLFKQISLTEIREIAVDTYNGDLAPLRSKLSSPDWSEKKTLGETGDASVTIPKQTAGAYLFVVVKETVHDIYVYSATAIEVVEQTLDVTCPLSVEKGDPLNVDTGLDGLNIHGAVMIRDSAYNGEIKLVSKGDILSTEIYLNGQEFIDSSFITETKDLDIEDMFTLLNKIKSIFGSSQFAYAYNIFSGSMSISTDSLTPGAYVLLVGVYNPIGSRIVGVYQKTVTVRPEYHPPVNVPPVADAGADRTALLGIPASFDGSGSSDSDGTIVSYSWSFGDGGTGTGVSPSHIYTAAGTYTVSLTVRDNRGGTGSDSLTVTVEEEATPDVIEDLPPDEAADILEDMDAAEAADIIEEINAEAAAEIVEEMTEDAAVYVLVEVDTSSAATIMEAVEEEEAGDLINAAVQTGRTDQFSDIMLEMEEDSAAGALLASEPESGAEFVETMANKDLTSTAEIVEAAVNLRLRELEPEAQEELLGKAADMLEEVSVESLVALFMEIITLPATPSTVATVFEVMDLGKVLEVVEAWIDLEAYEGLATVFDLLTQETLGNIYLGMASADRTALYPYLSDETRASLPSISVFQVSEFTVMPSKVKTGETVTISAKVTNIGEESGEYTAILKVNGVVEETKAVTLDVGVSTTVSFTISRNVVGVYTVEVDGQIGSFTVELVEPEPSPPPSPGRPNKKPVADAGPDQTVYVDETVYFNGTGSYDPDGSIMSWIWIFGDGETASGVTTSHTYSELGNYTVTITVKDNRNAEASDNCSVEVREIPPTPPIIPPLPPILSDLTITPEEVELGEDVTISLVITNIDSQPIDYIVNIKIRELTLLVDVELEPYESKTVSRTITQLTEGTFNVTVDGMTGSFTVTSPPTPLRPAEFVVTNLTVSPTEVLEGEQVTVTVKVTNIGEEEGSHTVVLKLDGVTEETAEVTLEGGASTTVSFTLTEAEGVHTVGVDDLTKDFTVTAPPGPVLSPGYVAGIMILIIAAGAAVYMLYRSGRLSLPKSTPEPKNLGD